MKYNESLFYLIKSLTKREKDNFSRLSRVRGEQETPKYMSLFKAIDGASTYHEPTIRRKVAKKISTSTFPEVKKQLSRLILRSLITFDESSVASMQHMLEECRILKRRRIFPMAKRKLKKAMEMAEAGEHYHVWLELCEELEGIIYLNNSTAEFEKLFLDLMAQKEIIRQKYIRFISMKDLYRKEVSINLRKEAEQKPVGFDFMESDAFRRWYGDHPPADCKRSQIIYHRLYSRIFSWKGDDNIERNLYHASKTLDIIRENPFLMEEMREIFFGETTRKAIVEMTLRRYDECWNTINALLEVKVETTREAHMQYVCYSANIINYVYGTDDYERVANKINYLERGFELHRSKLGTQTQILILGIFAYLYWINEDDSGSLSWVRELLQFPEREIRRKDLAIANAIQMTCAYDRQDWDYLESCIRSRRRSLDENIESYREEMIFMELLRKLIREKEPARIPNHFKHYWNKFHEDQEQENFWQSLPLIQIWMKRQLRKYNLPLQVPGKKENAGT